MATQGANGARAGDSVANCQLLSPTVNFRAITTAQPTLLPQAVPGELQRLGVEPYPSNEYTTTDLITGSIDWHVADQIVNYDAGYWKYDINNSDAPDTANQVPGITAANPIPRLPFQFNTPSTAQYAQTDELRVSSETPLFDFMDYTAGFFYRDTRNASEHHATGLVPVGLVRIAPGRLESIYLQSQLHVAAGRAVAAADQRVLRVPAPHVPFAGQHGAGTGGSSALDQVFGNSGYYRVGVNQIGMTPPQEFGLTVTYSIGSR